jgi:hypothetical protein
MKHLFRSIVRKLCKKENDYKDELTKQSVEQIERDNDAEDASDKVVQVTRNFGCDHPGDQASVMEAVTGAINPQIKNASTPTRLVMLASTASALGFSEASAAVSASLLLVTWAPTAPERSLLLRALQ